MGSARIYGQDAIREKNQALSFIKMSSRIDACSSRIETAVRMGQMTGAMQGVMNSTTATTTPVDQVDSLIQYVADTNNLELGEAFTEAGPIGNKVPSLKQPAEQQQQQIQQPVAISATDDLEARLNSLRK